MTSFETLAIVLAVYGVVFLAHRATQVVDKPDGGTRAAYPAARRK